MLRRLLISLVTSTAAAASILLVGTGSAVAAPAACPDVQIVFARGTLEFPGLGLAGAPFAQKLESLLPGKTVDSYAVNYEANVLQTSSGPGATDLTREVTSLAARCSNTRFVLGGYSQGASVVTIAVGLTTRSGTPGEVLAPELASRVDAIVVFGNPLGRQGGSIEADSPLYGSKTRSFCAPNEPVCSPGFDFPAHLAYLFNGDLDRAARFAADKVIAA
ncbi:cutinase [Rhodococcoides trifolii]|uniref:Cutinase n=1 Tax=Rhodococcoides trifolii TaxID=908250 RepID=A0A917FPM7_9NOCA|nr:cutinase family protein [Rhodococcus trifolii]GGF93037.1 cutinase [Rhodococcus trifolii]